MGARATPDRLKEGKERMSSSAEIVDILQTLSDKKTNAMDAYQRHTIPIELQEVIMSTKIAKKVDNSIDQTLPISKAIPSIGDVSHAIQLWNKHFETLLAELNFAKAFTSLQEFEQLKLKLQATEAALAANDQPDVAQENIEQINREIAAQKQRLTIITSIQQAIELKQRFEEKVREIAALEDKKKALFKKIDYQLAHRPKFLNADAKLQEILLQYLTNVEEQANHEINTDIIQPATNLLALLTALQAEFNNNFQQIASFLNESQKNQWQAFNQSIVDAKQRLQAIIPNKPESLLTNVFVNSSQGNMPFYAYRHNIAEGLKQLKCNQGPDEFEILSQRFQKLASKHATKTVQPEKSAHADIDFAEVSAEFDHKLTDTKILVEFIDLTYTQLETSECIYRENITKLMRNSEINAEALKLPALAANVNAIAAQVDSLKEVYNYQTLVASVEKLKLLLAKVQAYHTATTCMRDIELSTKDAQDRNERFKAIYNEKTRSSTIASDILFPAIQQTINELKVEHNNTVSEPIHSSKTNNNQNATQALEQLNKLGLTAAASALATVKDNYNNTIATILNTQTWPAMDLIDQLIEHYRISVAKQPPYAYKAEYDSIHTFIVRNGSEAQLKRFYSHCNGVMENFYKEQAKQITNKALPNYRDFLRTYAPSVDDPAPARNPGKNNTTAKTTNSRIVNFLNKAPQKLSFLFCKTNLKGRSKREFQYYSPRNYKKFLVEHKLLKPATTKENVVSYLDMVSDLINASISGNTTSIAALTDYEQRRMKGRFLGARKGSQAERLQKIWFKDFADELNLYHAYLRKFKEICANFLSIQGSFKTNNFIYEALPYINALNEFQAIISEQKKIIDMMIQEFTQGEVHQQHFKGNYNAEFNLAFQYFIEKGLIKAIKVENTAQEHVSPHPQL